MHTSLSQASFPHFLRDCFKSVELYHVTYCFVHANQHSVVISSPLPRELAKKMGGRGGPGTFLYINARMQVKGLWPSRFCYSLILSI